MGECLRLGLAAEVRYSIMPIVMRILLRLLTDLLWPVRQPPGASRAPLDIYLRPLIVLAIVVLVGPDLFAFVELTTMLELLGAALFMVAFAAGYRLMAATWLEWLRRLLLPAEYAWLFGIPGRPSAKVFGTLFVARNGIVLALPVLMTCLGVAILTGIAA